MIRGLSFNNFFYVGFVPWWEATCDSPELVLLFFVLLEKTFLYWILVVFTDFGIELVLRGSSIRC